MQEPRIASADFAIAGRQPTKKQTSTRPLQKYCGRIKSHHDMQPRRRSVTKSEFVTKNSLASSNGVGIATRAQQGSGS